MGLKTALFIALGIFGAAFFVVWVTSVGRERLKREAPGPLDLSIGFGVNFLDTLGIGSFATTTSCFKLWSLVKDELIPGTLNVGLTLAGVLEAFIYIAIVDVEATTLTAMIAAAVLGAWFGAGVVSRLPRRQIQIGIGVALLTTAGFGLMTQLRWFLGGGDLNGLTGSKLLVAVCVSSVLGALKTLGIGFYAPCMMMVYLMGMNPRAAFPIMMGSVAFVGPVASVQFIRQKRYHLKSALGLTLGGIPGVLVAAFLVRSLPLEAVRWLVIGVVVYTAVMMLRSAGVERARAHPAGAARPQ
jgi:uncharacterized membrane protein YfcA